VKNEYYVSPACAPGEHDAGWIVFQLTDKLCAVIRDMQRTITELSTKHNNYKNITLRGIIEMHVLSYIDDDRWPAILPDLGSEPEADDVLGCGAFDCAVPTDYEYWRSECHGVKVYSDSAYVVALDKYTSLEVESLDILDCVKNFMGGGNGENNSNDK